MTNFFFASTKIFSRFHRFDQFFSWKSYQKKNQNIWRDIFIFFCDIWVFFLKFKKCLVISQKKTQISKKKTKISLWSQRFLLLYGIKRGYHMVLFCLFFGWYRIVYQDLNFNIFDIKQIIYKKLIVNSKIKQNIGLLRRKPML